MRVPPSGGDCARDSSAFWLVVAMALERSTFFFLESFSPSPFSLCLGHRYRHLSLFRVCRLVSSGESQGVVYE